MSESNQNVKKPGVGAWLYAILCAAAAIGSIVIAVTNILRTEILSCILFLGLSAPVFGIVSWLFGWVPIRDYRRSQKGANKE